MLYDHQIETIQGYEFRESVRIGGKDYILAENAQADQPFVVWQRTENDFMASYEDGHFFENYLDAMIDFTERIKNDAQQLKDYYVEQDIDTEPFQNDVCVEDSQNGNYKGQFVLIKASAIAPEFRIPGNQICFVVGGNGCSPDALGTKVYCKNMSGEDEVWRRSSIAGIIDQEGLPEKYQDVIAAFKTRERGDEMSR